MATTVVPLPLTPEATQVYTVSAAPEQRHIEAMINQVILNFASMGSTAGANRALYADDFFQWTQTTVALLLAAKWPQIDVGCLTEELNDLGISQHNAVSSDLYQVLIHLLKWHYQPERRVEGHSWRDTIVEHRDRIDRLCTRSPSLRRQLPDMLKEEYPRARRRASIQTALPLSTFPETCPWADVEQILDADFWP